MRSRQCEADTREMSQILPRYIVFVQQRPQRPPSGDRPIVMWIDPNPETDVIESLNHNAPHVRLHGHRWPAVIEHTIDRLIGSCSQVEPFTFESRGEAMTWLDQHKATIIGSSSNLGLTNRLRIITNRHVICLSLSLSRLLQAAPT